MIFPVAGLIVFEDAVRFIILFGGKDCFSVATQVLSVISSELRSLVRGKGFLLADSFEMTVIEAWRPEWLRFSKETR